jgi:ribonuclease J
LAEDGIIVVVVTMSKLDGSILSGPDVISRGFVYVRESVDLMDEAKMVAQRALLKCADNNKKDWASLKSSLKTSMGDFMYTKTKRKPMILPIIMEV